MKTIFIALGMFLSSAATAQEIPAKVDMYFRQVKPAQNGQLELEIVLRSRATKTVVISGDISPLSGCSDKHFYYVLLIDGKGMGLPEYSVLCYRGSDVTLKPGQEVSAKRIFDAPILKGVDTKKALVKFLWFEDNKSGRGVVGVLEIK